MSRGAVEWGMRAFGRGTGAASRVSPVVALNGVLLQLALLGCSSVQSHQGATVVDIARPKQPEASQPPEAEAESERPIPERYAGTFEGMLMSNEQLVPVTTELVFDGVELTGRYWFGEMDREEGSLSDCVCQSAARVTCTWSDSYGEGLLVMHFDAGLSAFRGRWASVADPASTQEWNGERAVEGDF